MMVELVLCVEENALHAALHTCAAAVLCFAPQTCAPACPFGVCSNGGKHPSGLGAIQDVTGGAPLTEEL